MATENINTEETMQKRRENKVLVECRPHPIMYARLVVVAIILLMMSIALMSLHVIGMGLLVLLIGAVGCFVYYLYIHSSYVELSTTNVTGKKGLINTVKLVSPIGKVQDIAIKNGLWGKILGYHDIIITTAGSAGKEYVYRNMKNAKELQEAFLEIAE